MTVSCGSSSLETAAGHMKVGSSGPAVLADVEAVTNAVDLI